GDPQGVVEAVHLDPEDSGKKDAGHGAEDVGDVEKAETLEVMAAFPDESHHEGEGGPHAHAPGQDGHGEDDGGKEKVAERIGFTAAQQQVLAEGKQFWNDEGAKTDAQFDAGIKVHGRNPELFWKRYGNAPAAPGADGQAEHKNGKHDRQDGGNDSKRSERQPRPHDLIDQAAASG